MFTILHRSLNTNIFSMLINHATHGTLTSAIITNDTNECSWYLLAIHLI